MPEASRFFDSTPEDERTYTADDFAEYFRRLVTNGIFNGGTNLQVSCDGNNIMTYLKPGYAWIEGYMYKVYNENFYVQHDLPDANNDRIDRVVLRLDKSLETRTISAKILKGVPAASPVAPALTRNDNVYEISLAQVRIIKGKSYIEGSQITDERLNTSVCGLVNSLIQADTTNIFNQFNAWYNSKTAEFQTQWNNWFTDATGDYNAEWQTWFNGTKDEWDTWFAAQQQQGYVLEGSIGVPNGIAPLDETGVVPDEYIEKGQPNGVASLDANGQLIQKPYVTGYYTGDGSASRTINLGFRPSAVLLTPFYNTIGTYSESGLPADLISVNSSTSWDYYYIFGGLFLDGTSSVVSVTRYNTTQATAPISFASNGFTVYKEANSSVIVPETSDALDVLAYTNDSAKKYRYIAWR